MAVNPNALTTYATVKAELGLPDDTKQSIVERLINAASDAIERYCMRKFQQATVTDTLRPSGTQRLVLLQTPVISITSISDDGSTVDSGSYTLENANAGIVYSDTAWASNDSWTPDATAPERVNGTGKRSLSVVYVGGYVLPNDVGTRTLPYDLEQACIDTVVSLYRRRGERLGIKAESVGDASVTYRDPSAGGILPDEVLPVLDGYRRLFVAV